MKALQSSRLTKLCAIFLSTQLATQGLVVALGETAWAKLDGSDAPDACLSGEACNTIKKTEALKTCLDDVDGIVTPVAGAAMKKTDLTVVASNDAEAQVKAQKEATIGKNAEDAKKLGKQECADKGTELDKEHKQHIKDWKDAGGNCQLQNADENPDSPNFGNFKNQDTSDKGKALDKSSKVKNAGAETISPPPYKGTDETQHQQVNQQRRQAAAKKKQKICDTRKEVAQKAEGQQKEKSNMNMGQLMQALAAVAAAAMAAMANKQAADNAGQAAAALSPQGLPTAPPVFAPSTNLAAGPGDVLSPMQPTVISGNGEGGAPSALAADAPTGASAGDLGTPFRTDTTKNGLPDAGGPLERAKADGQDPGKGGANGLGSGINTQATTDKADAEAQAQQAANRGNPAYDAGAGGNHGSMMGDKGADLSGMLSQFLPKKDEDPTANKGILEFGDRAPASGSGYGYNDSILGKGGNIFFRVHDTLQNIQKKDRVGI